MGLIKRKGFQMLKEYTKIPAPLNSDVALKIIPGHFATNHSHITNYMEILI